MMTLPPSEKTDCYVYVPVPVGKVEDVFRLLIGFEASPTDTERIVRRIYLESEAHFQALLRFLADRPEEPISTAETAEVLGLPNGAASLAGMLGAFARRTKNRYEGFWPFERLYNPGEDRSELIMEAAVAEIVNGIDVAS